MTEAKHTPGPWEAVGSVVFPKRRDFDAYSRAIGICACGDEIGPRGGLRYGEERDANAKLIAAAPETADERDRLGVLVMQLIELAAPGNAYIDLVWRDKIIARAKEAVK